MPWRFNPFTGDLDWTDAGAHTQNTDTKLDEGGANEISVIEIPKKATANIIYYIDPNGDDSGPGTDAEPFATIQHAVDLLPKILNGYYASIILKDGAYSEGIEIFDFIEGSIYFWSDSWDADKVLIEVPSDKYCGISMAYNNAYVYIAKVSVKIQKNGGHCFACLSSAVTEIIDSKVGDNGNIETIGISSTGSQITVSSVADIDANKVSIGLKATYGGAIYMVTPDAFGDVHTDVSGAGLILDDGIQLNKADYDDAITKKHTQLCEAADFTKLDGLDCPLSPTVCIGGDITEGTNAGTFQHAALTAWFRSSDSDAASLVYATKTLEDNIAITNPNTKYIVVLSYNAGNPAISISESTPNLTQNIPIGRVYREADNTVHYISGGYNLYNASARLHMRARALRELELASGSTIAYSGTNNFTMTIGKVYGGINLFSLATYDSAVTTFVPIYRDGGVGYTKGAARNTIDYGHYDNGSGSLASVGTSRYSCHWVYKHVDCPDIYVVYGRGSYKLAEAETELEPTSPDYVGEFGCLIGKIIAPQAGGSFTTIQMITDTVFSGTSVATHNELGGLNDGDDYEHITQTQKTKVDGIVSLSEILTWGTL